MAILKNWGTINSMCYSAIYDREVKDLTAHFDLPEPLPTVVSGERFFPRGKTFVVAPSQKLGQPTLREMQYYLIPPWSQDEKYTGSHSSYNARLEKQRTPAGAITPIHANGLWGKFFGSHHCVVPLTQFFEICRLPGSLAQDHEVVFQAQEILFAAGIYSWWKSPEKSFNSFAMITTTPSPYIQSVGHQRSPLFLNCEDANRWLKPFEKPEEAYQFLKLKTSTPQLSFQKIRKVKSLPTRSKTTS